MELPNKQYSIIYADPPWAYRNCGTTEKSRGNAAQHYPTMSTDDICNLPIPQICGGGGSLISLGNFPKHRRSPASHGGMGVRV